MEADKVSQALDRTLKVPIASMYSLQSTYSAKDLRLDYLDLYLIHWPLCFKPDATGNSQKGPDGKIILSDARIEETWMAINVDISCLSIPFTHYLEGKAGWEGPVNRSLKLYHCKAERFDREDWDCSRSQSSGTPSLPASARPSGLLQPARYPG